MNLDQFRYFLEAAKHCHLAKAADALNISVGAVSHSIGALEKELGRDLFAKRGRNIVLTGHGQLLMERAKEFLAQAEAIKEEVASEKAEWQGLYRLAATHLITSHLLVPAWTRIQNENPNLIVEIHTLRSAHVVASVVNGQSDFGVCLNPLPHPDLASKCIYDGRLVLVLAKGHPLLKLPLSERIKRLSEYPAALPKALQGIENCESHPALAKAGIQPKIAFIYDSDDIAAKYIARSKAWGLFPDWTAGLYKNTLVSFTPKDWNAALHVTAVWSKNRYLTRVLKQLIRNLEEAAKSKI